MSGSEYGLAERQALLNKLLDAVKQCHIRFGGRTELATDGDSRVVCLCTQFENAFQHGLRKNNKGLAAFKHVTEMVTGINLRNVEDEPVFWHIMKDLLTKHEFERYMVLKNITTDAGRGRAWLRSALNEHALERYIHMLLGDPSILTQYYEDWAFVMDQERSSMLPMIAAGLDSILFAINIDNPDLNILRIHPVGNNPISIFHSSTPTSDPMPVVASPPKDSNDKTKKKKRKALAQIVSFDENDLAGNSRCIQVTPSYFSAPPTCLSSPTEVGNDCSRASAPNCVEMPPNSLDTTSREIATNERTENDSTHCWHGVPSVNTDGAVASSSDLECSGSCEDLQQSEGSQGSGVGETNVVENNSVQTIESPANKLVANQCSRTSSSKPPNLDSRIIQSSLKFDDKKLSPSMAHTKATVLTPINDVSIGELIPVTGFEEVHSEDSVSLPSYSEDSECTAAVLALQKVLQNCASSSLQLVIDKSPPSSNLVAVSGGRDRSDSITSGDLKQAVIALMQKKDEIEDQNKSLRNLLDREMEMCSGLRVEMEELGNKNQEKTEKLQSKIQALSRENELLKHQLRKYVGAVQMLKKDGIKTDGGDSVPPIPEVKPYIDYHLEATEYERKLIQVAEMHGELMEFNERLHRLLSQKESVVRRLREELIDLRGPLPDDNQTSDDDISVTSDYDASSMSAATRSLINIWIPSAFLAGKSSDSHHVYQVYIRIRDDEWNIYRRYAQFYALHKLLKKQNPIVNTYDFPPKKAIGNKDAKFVEERRKRLQHYLRCVVNLLIQSHAELGTNPDRESFVSLLPFFGELPSGDDVIGRRRAARNPFSRFGSSHQSVEPAVQHYTGL